jgi:hypothetical protein
MEQSKKFPVRVVANKETGAIVNVSDNNPEYGYITLQQEKLVIDDNGFGKLKTLSALLQGTVEMLQGLNYYSGQAVEGKIHVKESMEPFSAKYPEKDIKKAGATEIVCTVDGDPIYRKAIWDITGSKEDVYIQHNNIDELRAAFNAQKAEAMQEDSDFQIG